MLNRHITPERKTLFRAGQILAVLGLLSFLSVFVSAAMSFGPGSGSTNVQSMAIRAVGGMIAMIAGGVLCTIGAAGVAGSMLNLDPEQARKDLEPWARMSGGLQKASLEEMGVDLPKITGALASGLGNATAANGETLESRLRGLHALYKDGILSEAEYQREKQELLDGK
ncbi:MAG: SHOCT domain-containing protein [Pirellulales bacterium]|nr:SHOCT domain-containing protein [Pirellulales bacterium]